jgi:hypothetical protein
VTIEALFDQERTNFGFEKIQLLIREFGKLIFLLGVQQARKECGRKNRTTNGFQEIAQDCVVKESFQATQHLRSGD